MLASKSVEIPTPSHILILLAPATISLPGSCLPPSRRHPSHVMSLIPPMISTSLQPKPKSQDSPRGVAPTPRPQFPLTSDSPSTFSRKPCNWVDLAQRACLLVPQTHRAGFLTWAFPSHPPTSLATVHPLSSSSSPYYFPRC